MHILLTNDDGIYSLGLSTLYTFLKKYFTVTVVAPDSQRSSVRHAITLSQPIHHQVVHQQGKFFGHAVSGTPADCVKLGLEVILKKKPDMVISGINLGPNDGCSVFYSGTVAGAREGALNNIPSMAVSLDTFVDPNFSYASQLTVKLVKGFKKLKLPSNTFVSVNVPNLPKSKIKGIKFTRQGLVPIHGKFIRRRDPRLRDYFWMTGRLPKGNRDLDFDTYALSQGYVTNTPILCDATDYASLMMLTNKRSSLS